MRNNQPQFDMQQFATLLASMVAKELRGATNARPQVRETPQVAYTARPAASKARKRAKAAQAPAPNGFVKWLRETAPQRKQRQIDNKALARKLWAHGITNFHAMLPDGRTVWQAAKDGEAVTVIASALGVE